MRTDTNKPVSLCVLGATGSIGQSTLDIIRRNPHQYRLASASGFSNMKLMADICLEFRPKTIVVGSNSNAAQLKASLPPDVLPNIMVGNDALDELAADPGTSTLVAAIVGAAGLSSTLSAVRAGKRVLLANKEALVMSGALLMEAAKESGATLLPIDSEHNAIFQCLSDHRQRHCDLSEANEIKKVLLTASGGPFRGKSREELLQVTPSQALDHPNWSMGPKISIDSATMMNKGLELIEACWLFNLQAHQVEVVIHPQSFIHSMVEYIDGSVIAQMGLPDMRTPIAHALAWPERILSGVKSPIWSQLGPLTFEAPDLEAFPCLKLAIEALSAGGIAPTVLNAVNEVAVEAFIAEQISFMSIPDLVSEALAATENRSAVSVEAIMEADSWARAWARQHLK